MYKLIVIDTETTGLAKGARPVEIAWCTASKDDEYVEYSERFNPEMLIDAQAIEVHGISNESVKDCRKYTEFTMPQTEYIVGHNISYDIRILSECDPDVKNIKSICTLALARMAWPELPSHKLDNLILYLEPDFKFIAHSALGDVMATKLLLKFLVIKLYVRSTDELYSLSEEARIPKSMPFGKHKGVPFEKLDKSYISWALDNLDVDDYLKAKLLEYKQAA